MAKQKKQTRRSKRPRTSTLQKWHMPEPIPYLFNETDSNHAARILTKFLTEELHRTLSKQTDWLRFQTMLSERFASTNHLLQELQEKQSLALQGTKFRLDPKALTQYDVIDVTDMLDTYDPQRERPRLEAYDKKMENAGLSLFTILPCFTSGYIDLGTQNDCHTIIMFSQEHLDVHASTAKLYIAVYCDFMLTYAQTVIVEPSTSDAGPAYQFNIEPNSVITPLDRMMAIPPSELNWTNYQKLFYQHVNIQIMRDSLAASNASEDYASRQLRIFFPLIHTINMYLDQKPIIEQDETTHEARTPRASDKSTVAPAAHEPARRRTQTIGGIKIISSRPPMHPDMARIRHYVVPAWTVRGHTRTYKSGKTVYVKPCVRRRKKLDAPDATPLPQTLLVKPSDNDPTTNPRKE